MRCRVLPPPAPSDGVHNRDEELHKKAAEGDYSTCAGVSKPIPEGKAPWYLQTPVSTIGGGRALMLGASPRHRQ